MNTDRRLDQQTGGHKPPKGKTQPPVGDLTGGAKCRDAMGRPVECGRSDVQGTYPGTPDELADAAAAVVTSQRAVTDAALRSAESLAGAARAERIKAESEAEGQLRMQSDAAMIQAGSIADKAERVLAPSFSAVMQSRQQIPIVPGSGLTQEGAQAILDAGVTISGDLPADSAAVGIDFDQLLQQVLSPPAPPFNPQPVGIVQGTPAPPSPQGPVDTPYYPPTVYGVDDPLPPPPLPQWPTNPVVPGTGPVNYPGLTAENPIAVPAYPPGVLPIPELGCAFDPASGRWLCSPPTAPPTGPTPIPVTVPPTSPVTVPPGCSTASYSPQTGWRAQPGMMLTGQSINGFQIQCPDPNYVAPPVPPPDAGEEIGIGTPPLPGCGVVATAIGDPRPGFWPQIPTGWNYGGGTLAQHAAQARTSAVTNAVPLYADNGTITQYLWGWTSCSESGEPVPPTVPAPQPPIGQPPIGQPPIGQPPTPPDDDPPDGPPPTQPRDCCDLDDPETLCKNLSYCSCPAVLIQTPQVGVAAQGQLVDGGSSWNFFAPAWAKTAEVLDWFGDKIGDAFEGTYEAALDLAESFLGLEGRKCLPCPDTYVPKSFDIGLQSWTETITGTPLARMFAEQRYAWEAMNPVLIPSQGEADNMRLSNVISAEQWECYTKMHGNAPKHFALSLKSKYQQLTGDELVRLYNRKILNKDSLTERMRRIGVWDDSQIQERVTLSEQQPGISDLVRFLVRDAGDEVNKDWSVADAEFRTKYGKKIQDWAEWQNIPYEVFLYAWRSHYEYPSNTAIYQMLHRLRPGRVSADLEVTKQTAADVLAINDVEPTWRERLLAVSYLTPTRSDLKESFIKGILSEDVVREGLLDVGYDEAGARLLMQIFKGQRALYENVRKKLNSPYTPKQAIRDFMAGGLNSEETTTILADLGLDQDARELASRHAERGMEAARRRKCLAGYRRKFMTGEIDSVQAREAVLDLGLSPQQVDPIVSGWRCELLSKSKEVPAAKLATWVAAGVLSLDEFGRRLVNLGYRAEDVNTFMAKAVADAVKRQAAEAEKQRKAQERAAERRRKELEKAAKKSGGENTSGIDGG